MKSLDTQAGRRAVFGLWLLVMGLLIILSARRGDTPDWLAWPLRIVGVIFLLFFVLIIYLHWVGKKRSNS